MFLLSTSVCTALQQARECEHNQTQAFNHNNNKSNQYNTGSFLYINTLKALPLSFIQI